MAEVELGSGSFTSYKSPSKTQHSPDALLQEQNIKEEKDADEMPKTVSEIEESKTKDTILAEKKNVHGFAIGELKDLETVVDANEDKAHDHVSRQCDVTDDADDWDMDEAGMDIVLRIDHPTISEETEGGITKDKGGLYNVKVYTCEKCSFVTEHRHKLRYHMVRKHENARHLQCEYCQFMTCWPKNLKEHVMAKHTGEKPHKCEMCDYRAVRERTIKIHKHTKHNIICETVSEEPEEKVLNVEPVFVTGSVNNQDFKAKIYHCDQCEYVSKYHSDVKKHKVIHGGTKVYKCNVCKFETRWSENYRRHLLRHSQGRTHKCDQCEYVAYTKRALKLHSYTHTKEKACTCEICGGYFLTHATLKRHQLTHQGEKEYHCDQCDYKAYFKSYVDIHKRLHMDIKPFPH